jgi:hypothetical protein
LLAAALLYQQLLHHLSHPYDAFASSSYTHIILSPFSILMKNVISGANNERADEAIIQWAIVKGIPFNALDGSAWKNVVKALKTVSASYEPPNRRRLSGKLLDSAFAETKLKVDTFINGIERQKATLTADGMTYQKKPFENYMLLSGRRIAFIGCDDATGHLEEGGIRDGTFVAEGLIEVMEDIGPSKVIHIVLDGASNNAVAREILEHKYPHVTTSHCLMHNCNLFFGDVKKIPEVNAILKWKDDITELINSSNGLHALFQKYVKEHNDGQTLEFIKGSSTRMGKEFIELQRFRRLIQSLKSLATSPQLNKFKGYEVLVDFNENIRTHVRRMDELLTLLYPSYYFLRVSDMSRSLISKVYPYCQKIISHLERSKDSVTYGIQLYEAALDRFGDYCNDLHKAAYYLDPAFIDEVNSSQEDTTTPLFRLIEKLCGVLFPEEQDFEELQSKILSQWGGFRDRSAGLFSKDVSWKASKRMTTLEWWGTFGSHCPELRTLSEAVHNQHISSGVNEKAWAFYKFFKSKRRGRLGHTKVEKSQFVAANKRLEESLQPQDDGFIFTQWTAADEAFTALLATAGGGIDEPEEVNKPKWCCFEESWEDGARANTQVNFFKVKEKYKGMYLFDEEDEDWQGGAHYQINDVYWQVGARGALKVWRADCFKVIEDRNSGKWVAAKDENGESYKVDYLINHSIFPVILAARALNSHVEIVEA